MAKKMYWTSQEFDSREVVRVDLFLAEIKKQAKTEVAQQVPEDTVGWFEMTVSESNDIFAVTCAWISMNKE